MYDFFKHDRRKIMFFDDELKDAENYIGIKYNQILSCHNSEETDEDKKWPACINSNCKFCHIFDTCPEKEKIEALDSNKFLSMPDNELLKTKIMIDAISYRSKKDLEIIKKEINERSRGAVSKIVAEDYEAVAKTLENKFFPSGVVFDYLNKNGLLDDPLIFDKIFSLKERNAQKFLSKEHWKKVKAMQRSYKTKPFYDVKEIKK